MSNIRSETQRMVPPVDHPGDDRDRDRRGDLLDVRLRGHQVLVRRGAHVPRPLRHLEPDALRGDVTLRRAEKGEGAGAGCHQHGVR